MVFPDACAEQSFQETGMWQPPEPSHGLCCGIFGPTYCETDLGMLKCYREKHVRKQTLCTFLSLLGEPNTVCSGNSFSSQPTLFSTA